MLRPTFVALPVSMLLLSAHVHGQAAPYATFTGATFNGRFGKSVAFLGDVNGDGVGDLAVGSPVDVPPTGSGRGIVRVISTADGGVLYQIDHTGFVDFGHAMAAVGDVNGDGRTDFVVGSTGGNGPGWASLHSGANGGVLHAWPGLLNEDGFGTAVAGPGDLDGDGVPDVVASTPRDHPDHDDEKGYAMAFSGATGALLFHVVAGQGEGFGLGIAGAGDWNADGRPDVIVNEGEVFVPSEGLMRDARVLSGVDAGVLASFTEVQVASSPLEDDELAVVGLGDLDSDGYPEVGLGSFFGDAVHVRSAPAGDTLFHVSDGLLTYTRFGGEVALCGDVDGDGVSDLAASMPRLQGADRVRILSGTDGGLISTVGGAPSFYEDFGTALVGVGDLNGDLFPDLAVAQLEDDGLYPYPGSVHLVSLTPTTTWSVPADLADVQSAIDIAKDGDVIVVGPGSWQGSLDFQGKAIEVRSTRGSLFTRIVGDGPGPVVRFTSGEGPSTVLRGFRIEGGVADVGGGVLIDGGSPRLVDCILAGNRALTAGGGLGVRAGAPVLERCRIEGNVAPVGGGVDLAASSLTARDLRLVGNAAGQTGAALACDGASSADLERATVAENRTEPGGAALLVDGSLALRGSIARSPALLAGSGTLSATYSNVEGGVAGVGNIDEDPLFYDAEELVFDLRPGSPCLDTGDPASTIDADGTAPDMGADLGTRRVPSQYATIQGAIDAASDGTSVLIGPGTWYGNLAVDSKAVSLLAEDVTGTTIVAIDEGPSPALEYGGPPEGSSSFELLNHDLPTPYVEAVRIRGLRVLREPGTQGGGIHLRRSAFRVEDCEVEGHTGPDARGLEIDNCPLGGSVRRCLFRANGSILDDGGGIRASGGPTVIEDCVLDSNRAMNGAAVRGSARWPLTLRRSLFVRNEASNRGGAVRVYNWNHGDQAQLVVDRCTFAENVAGHSGGAIEIGSHTTPKTSIRSAILWGNTPDQIDAGGSQPADMIAYSDVDGGAPGTGNLDLDPQFVDAVAGDWRIGPMSPSIDAGDPSGASDPDGSLPDQGWRPFEPLAPPSIESASPAQVEAVAVGGQELTLLGTGLHHDPAVSVDGVLLGAGDVAATHDPFSGASTLRFDVPLVSTLGTVPVSVATPFGLDSTSVEVLAPSAPVIQLSSSSITAAGGVDVTLGSEPGDLAFLGTSPLLAPTVVPGLFSVDIGGGLASLILLGTLPVGPAGWSQLHVPTDTWTVGLTAWFQAAVYDVSDPGFPLESTNVAGATVDG